MGRDEPRWGSEDSRRVSRQLLLIRKPTSLPLRPPKPDYGYRVRDHTSSAGILSVSLCGLNRPTEVTIERALCTRPESSEDKILHLSNDRGVRRWAVGITS